MTTNNRLGIKLFYGTWSHFDSSAYDKYHMRTIPFYGQH